MSRTGVVALIDGLTGVFKLVGAAFAIALVAVLLANIISVTLLVVETVSFRRQ